jgi:hypothetical protein
MDPALFNQIKTNFKNFLEGKIHPKSKEVINESIEKTPANEQVESMENTCLFGKEDAAIGYKKYYTDKDGNRKYRIVSCK